ncbi:LysE family transporter [Streptomyces olivaceoviridis]|uniref:LysE family transporter n=1 Tax=Streptomyces olivaceoviridis TaxID=1921 RepID=UPI0033B8BC10
MANCCANGFLPGFAIGLGAASIEVLYAGFGLAGVGKLLDVPVLRTVLGLAGAAVMARLQARQCRAVQDPLHLAALACQHQAEVAGHQLRPHPVEHVQGNSALLVGAPPPGAGCG